MIRISRGDLRRVVVAIDPATTSGAESDSTGIVVVARGPHQPSVCKLDSSVSCPGHAYVLDDRTCHVAPDKWARVALDAFDEWQADRIIGEDNNGGDMIGTLIHTARPDAPYRSVRATRGKKLRAEPVAALYQQGRVHHVGVFPELESQMVTWTPGDSSPDRVDALVWGCVALDLVASQGAAFIASWKQQIKRGHNRPRPRLQVLTGGLCDHRWRAGTCVFCGESNRTE